MSLKAALLDFDGVIVESVDLKTEAFRTLFAQEQKALPAILALHRNNGGMSRFEKFDIIYRDILRRPLVTEEKDRLGRQFSELVVEQVVACPWVRGAREWLARHLPRLPLFLISATPTEELRHIVSRRELGRYFREVHGSPPDKTEVTRDILARHGWTPDEVVFVGDAPNDHAAASAIGVRFVGRVPSGRESPFAPDVETVPDLAYLDLPLTIGVPAIPQAHE